MFNKNWIAKKDLTKFMNTVDAMKEDSAKLITKGFYEIAKECQKHHGFISMNKLETIIKAVKRTGE